MRIAEKIAKFVFFLIFVYSAIYVLMDQREMIRSEFLKTYLHVDGYVLFFFIIISAILCIITPTWDVGKYLNTHNVSKIADFKWKWRIGFAKIFLGFFGALLLTTSAESLVWWVGFICVILSYFSTGRSFFNEKK